jgi:hypothetical protein
VKYNKDLKSAKQNKETKVKTWENLIF